MAKDTRTFNKDVDRRWQRMTTRKSYKWNS